MDPSTLKVDTVKVLSTLAIDGGNMVALDAEKQAMYWMSTLFEDEAKPGNPPFYLVQVSLSSIVSQSPICLVWNNPWSAGHCLSTLNSS
jgi:hypothetical protein